MQHTNILSLSHAVEPSAHRNVVDAIVAPFVRIFSCWHFQLSRPFSDDEHTYQVCLNCGRRREFDPETWTSHGQFYVEAPDKRRPPVNSLLVTVDSSRYAPARIIK